MAFPDFNMMFEYRTRGRSYLFKVCDKEGDCPLLTSYILVLLIIQAKRCTTAEGVLVSPLSVKIPLHGARHVDLKLGLMIVE